MLTSYFKTALRFLLKNKTFSLINIIGLSIGTLCCLYILLYVQDQYSYDKHETHATDIYRVTADLKYSGEQHHIPRASPPIAGMMKKDFGEVLQYTRVLLPDGFGVEQSLLKYKDRSFYETNTAYVDSTFFELFTYHFRAGNPATALQQPFSIVLEQAIAEKLFGKEDPIGKTIHINNKAGDEDLRVTGVFDRSLGKSHLNADIYITMNSGLIGRIVNRTDAWAGGNFLYAYVQLRPGTDAAALEKKLAPFLKHYGQEQLKTLGMEKQLHLQSIGSIHTTAGYESESSKTMSPSISPSFLNILVLIALLIQVIACINFMNLSTARASRRAKEVGVRKVIGAGRADLIRQFLGESLLLSLIGILLALPLLVILLPYLNNITGADIPLSFFRNYRLWLILAGLVAGTGLLAGSYPSFYLSAFQAIRVIKGNFTNQVSAAGIRRSLVVFQFVLSIVLITGVVIIFSQLQYIKNKDLGFQPGQKLVFSIYTGGVNVGRLADDFRLLPGVKAATRSNYRLGKPLLMSRAVYPPTGDHNQVQIVGTLFADKYFVQTAGIHLLAGRDFRDHDSGRVLINESMAQRLHIDPRTAEGARIYVPDDRSAVADKNASVPYEIVGVVKDFNFNSLHETVTPLMLMYNPDFAGSCDVTVSCNTTNYPSLLSQLAAVWQKDAPATPFEYSFVDDQVQSQYETEFTLSRIINSFTLMAIFISCLGLFGLAAFHAEQRNKEIGIRKILGASISGIVRLLSRDMLQLLGIALIISIPISWWAMHQWLQGFAYRVPISWWMFALAGFLTILIAALTISFQTIRAARANPTKALRSE